MTNKNSWFFTLTPEQKQSIIDRYTSGESTKTIADSSGASRSNILYFLKRNGVKLRPKSKWNIYTYDKTFFDKIDTEEKAYVLGFLYADGCVYQKTYRVSVEISSRDIDILNKIRAALKSDAKFTYFYRKNKKEENKEYTTFAINDKELIPKVEKLGLVSAKSLILKFPTADQVPDHLIHHFIRGYFDGDGCIHIGESAKGKRVSVSIIGTIEFCKAIEKFTKLGNVYNRKNIENLSTYSIDNAVDVQLFFDIVYKNATIFLDRKYKKFQSFLNNRSLFTSKSPTSRYHGVSILKNGKIICNHLGKRIGTFKTEIDAASAYDNYCIANNTNLDKLNFSDSKIK
jgi:intein/homing endonuclease